MKEKIKFLLISPTSPERRVTRGDHPHRTTRAFRFSMLPCLYVAAAMPPYMETRIVDEDVEPVDYDADTDLVGISFMTANAVRAYEVADAFRQRGKPVIVGGYHPTFMPQEAIQHADAVCIGEAETSVPKMMEDFAAGRLAGFYDGGLADIRGLPVPDRRLLRQSAYFTTNTLQATRGCPYDCMFCSVSRFHHRRLRCRPVEEVIEELKQLGKYVLFQDDNVAVNPAHAKELFRQMIPLKKRWASQSSIHIVKDDELLRLAVRSGCIGLFIGFESLSTEALRSSRKSVNIAMDYAVAIRKLHAAGIAVFGAFVFGMDGDDEHVFENTLDFIVKTNIDVLQATILTPYPGTELREVMEREGRIFDRNWNNYDAGHAVYYPQHMSPATLESGQAWVLRQFHSHRAITQRTVRSIGYMNPGVVVKAVLPLNIGQRLRLAEKGAFEKARAFTPRMKLAR
ncbi:MAG: radical SAM protein [bacterium]